MKYFHIPYLNGTTILDADYTVISQAHYDSTGATVSVNDNVTSKVSWVVKTETDFNAVVLNTKPDPLSVAQTQKINEITSAYQQSTATFQSSATGTMYTYLADDTSMNKFNAKHYEVNTATYDGSDVNWYTEEEGGVLHKVSQFNQVWADGSKVLTDAFNRWDAMVKQIKAITVTTTEQDAINQVNAFTW